jgi:hypothetical protein
MAEKIRIELEDATKPGFQSINNGLKTVETQGRKTEDSVSDLNAELDSGKPGEYSAEVNKIGQELDQAAAKASQAKQELDKAASGKAAWTELWSKVQLGVSAFKVVAFAGKAAGQVITALAEQGVPAYETLNDSLKKYGETAIKVGTDQRLTQLLERVADISDRVLIPALERTAEYLLTTTDRVVKYGDSWANFFSGVTKEESDFQAGLEAMARNTERNLKKSSENQIAAKAILDKHDADAHAARMLQNIEEIDSEKQATELIVAFGKKRSDAYKGMASPDKARFEQSRADFERYTEQLKALEAKRKSLREAATAEEIADATAEFEAAMKLIEIRQAKERAAAEVGMQYERNKAVAAEMILQRTFDARKADFENYKALIEAKKFLDGNGNQVNIGEKIRGGIDPRQVAMEARRRREEAALRQFREQGQAEGRLDQNGQIINGYDDLPGNVGRRRAETKRAEDKIRREARLGFRKDFARGNVANEELEQAQSGLASQVVEKLASDSRVKEKEIQVLDALTKEANRTKEENAMIVDRLNKMGAALGFVAGRGQNGMDRAQRAGRP